MTKDHTQKPFAWVIPGSDTANDRGFIDAMAWEEGEFTKPLYAALMDVLRAEDALMGWLNYAEENLSEFDLDGEICGSAEDKLCPRCENSGCIQHKIKQTRIALATLALSSKEAK